jgi:Holliday junction resolvase
VSKNKQKGTLAETALVRYLQANGFPGAERRAMAGAKDLGDLLGAGQLTWEVKNQKTYSIPEWLRELQAEKTNANMEHGVLVIKPRGVGVSQVGSWWAVLTVKDFVELARDAGHGDERACDESTNIH